MLSFKNSVLFSCLIFYISNVESYIEKPGPTVVATKGEEWPKSVYKESQDVVSTVVTPFTFEVQEHNCDILQDAIKRYASIIKTMHKRVNNDISNDLESLNQLKINLTKPCEKLPHLDMNEKYNLTVNTPSNGDSILTSPSIWGILRGLETFSQLIYVSSDETKLLVNSTFIQDYPRFRHRGLLLDTSRHFIPVGHIFKTLDAMSYNKLNVFHWHIVDDQSFPFQSKVFPELSGKGAFHSKLVYTPNDVANIVEYARFRGIRVISEFDTPGHTRSWGEGVPEFITPCYKNGQPNGDYGPTNPAKESTYTFLQKLMKEIIEVFPDKYVHLGGDEVDFDCWDSNPEIKEYMAQNGIAGNYHKLEEMYIQRVIDMVDKLNASSVVWEEVYTNGVKMPNNTVVQVWINANKLNPVTKSGYPALLSSCWYLDHLSNGGDWEKYYKCEPFNYVDSQEQRNLIYGGEACMWAESVNENNVISRVWPRASAVAERLWSERTITDQKLAARRLEEHTCRMNSRGIAAQPPNRAGFCVY